MVLVHVHRFPNKQNHPLIICSNKAVGAAPVCPPERPRSGVSIPKKVCVSRIMRGEFNDGCTLAGRHGRAHRHRPYQSPSYFATQSRTNKIPSMRNSPQTKSTVHVQSAPTHLHANRAVCHYPIGVILSIAQGWQVQRSLPWVMMRGRRLPPWGLYFFSSHIITTRGEQMVSRMQIDFKKYNTDGIGSPPRLSPG